MDLMKILFGYFVFKSIFHEAQQCNIENNYYDDYDDCDCCNDYSDIADLDVVDTFDIFDC
jgi:hypothetical protein